MLILSRKYGEVINIGDDITVTILGIHGKQVRLGVDAPDDVDIYREEVYNRIQSEHTSKRNVRDEQHDT